MAQDFTLDDFQQQLGQFQKMDMRGMPGLSGMVPDEEDRDVAFNRIRQMIDAMTDEERKDPDIIDSSRRARIATSSGTQPDEVEKFLAQFHQMRALMRHMAGMSLWQRLKLALGFGKFPGQDREPS